MLVFIIIGTIIGAGFASGKEVYLFFYQFGVQGFLGILLCSTLLFIVLYKTFNLILKYNIKNYDDFLSVIYRNIFLKKINKNLMNIFLLISFFIMISGFGAYLNQNFNISNIIGACIIAVICFIVFLKDLNGISEVSMILVPILIFFILYIGILNLNNLKGIFKVNLNIPKVSFYNNWFVQSINYFSYNYILLLPILVNFREKLTKKNILKIAFISALIFGILLICIFIILNISTIDKINDIEMPAVYIVSMENCILKKVYGVIIIFSIVTTAVSEGMGFIKNQNIENEKMWKISMLICGLGIIISNFGFGNLVKILYPIIGIVGIFQIISICIN